MSKITDKKKTIQILQKHDLSKVKKKTISDRASSSVPVIQIINLTKNYKIFKNDAERAKALFFSSYKREKTALKNININIYEGESVALLGRNGAGKSTLSKLIAGVTVQTSGKIIVRKKVTALLELTAGFDPFYTGRENIYLRANFMNIDKKVIEKQINKIIEFADLNEFIDVQFRKYSSGMAARLGFAFNVFMNPKILLVDESLSVGDENFAEKCLKKVKEILSTGKVTFIFVTHSMDLAKKFCKRGIVFHDSKIIFDGSIDKAIAFYHRIN